MNLPIAEFPIGGTPPGGLAMGYRGLGLLGSVQPQGAYVAPIAVLAHGTGVSQSGDGYSATVTLNALGANAIIVSVIASSAVAYPIGTVTDNAGNTYVPMPCAYEPTYGVGAQLFYCIGATVSASLVVTVSTAVSGAYGPGMSVLAANNIGGVDDSNSLTGTGLPIQGRGIYPASNGSLFVSTCAYQAQNPDSGFSSLFQNGVVGYSYAADIAWLIQKTAAYVNPTWASAGGTTWAIINACFVPKSYVFSGLVDQLSVAPIYYSGIRKLRAAYAGKCINVLRDSDNTNMDIGFTATGKLDVAALTNFLDGHGGIQANGYITTWYDQSGGSRSLTQGTVSVMPQVAATGLPLYGTNNVINPTYPYPFGGTSGADTSLPTTTAARTLNSVYMPPNNTDAVNALGYGTTATGESCSLADVSPSGSPYWAFYGYDFTSGQTRTNALMTATVSWNGTTRFIYKNGAQVASDTNNSWSTVLNGTLYDGSDTVYLAYTAAAVCERMIWSSAISTADQTILSGSQVGYYGT